MLYDGIIGSTSLESVEFVLMIPEKVLTIEEIMVHTRAIITAPGTNITKVATSQAIICELSF